MKREQEEERALKARQMEELNKEREQLRIEQEEHEKKLKGKYSLTLHFYLNPYNNHCFCLNSKNLCKCDCFRNEGERRAEGEIAARTEEKHREDLERAAGQD